MPAGDIRNSTRSDLLYISPLQEHDEAISMTQPQAFYSCDVNEQSVHAGTPSSLYIFCCDSRSIHFCSPVPFFLIISVLGWQGG